MGGPPNSTNGRLDDPDASEDQLFAAGAEVGLSFATGSVVSESTRRSWSIPFGSDGTVRVNVSSEMQAKLDRLINSQVHLKS